jgi:hypothetical protein
MLNKRFIYFIDMDLISSNNNDRLHEFSSPKYGIEVRLLYEPRIMQMPLLSRVRKLHLVMCQSLILNILLPEFLEEALHIPRTSVER